jgi:hypothetical protein
MDVAAMRTAHENFLAVVAGGGQRAAYDNRASLDEWNLRRTVGECGGLSWLTEFISGDQLIVDEPWPLQDLVEGVGTIHVPRHAAQLAGLRS